MAPRYSNVKEEKADGATYTPKILADFVARRIVELFEDNDDRLIRVLDPALGDGELILSLLDELFKVRHRKIEVHGFDSNRQAINVAAKRVKQYFPSVVVDFQVGNFLEFVHPHFGIHTNGSLFAPDVPEAYDLVIANPPYVRTQILGASQAQLLAKQFSLSGRVDLLLRFRSGHGRDSQTQGHRRDHRVESVYDY